MDKEQIKNFEVIILWKSEKYEDRIKCNNYCYSDNYLILESSDYEQVVFNLLEIKMIKIFKNN